MDRATAGFQPRRDRISFESALMLRFPSSAAILGSMSASLQIASKAFAPRRWISASEASVFRKTTLDSTSRSTTSET
jgi:hypothetical protein